MTYTVTMPDLGQTTSEGKILKWLKSLGDKVAKGETLLEVETDKAMVEVEAFAGGYLRQVTTQEGDMAAALSPIALLTDSPDEPIESPAPESPVSAASDRAAPWAPDGFPASKSGAIAPAARRLAKGLGLDVGLVPGTGKGGLVTRADVETPLGQSEPTPSSSLWPGWPR